MEKVIYCPGSWDMLHAGHINIFRKAKQFGNKLIVGISTDSLIFRYKKVLPIISYKDRVAVIQDLKYVDGIIKQNTFFNIQQLKKYKVNVVILGTDWKGKPFKELDNAVKKLNIKVIYIPYTHRLSSSKIKEKIINNADAILDAQKARKLNE